MQALVSSSAIADDPGEVLLSRPPDAEGFYRDVALLALPACDGPEPFPRLADAARRSGAAGVFEFPSPAPDVPVGPAAATVSITSASPGLPGRSTP